MVELDKKNGEQKGLRTQVASLNHWTASGHVVVSDIFIILYYIIVLFFSKIRAPGRVRTANLTLGKDKAYHFTLVWLGPVIRAHASPGWAPLHLPPAAPRHPARESHTNIHHVKLEMIKKNKMQLSAARGNRTWPLLLVQSMANHYALQRLFPVL